MVDSGSSSFVFQKGGPKVACLLLSNLSGQRDTYWTTAEGETRWEINVLSEVLCVWSSSVGWDHGKSVELAVGVISDIEAGTSEVYGAREWALANNMLVCCLGVFRTAKKIRKKEEFWNISQEKELAPRAQMPEAGYASSNTRKVVR